MQSDHLSMRLCSISMVREMEDQIVPMLQACISMSQLKKVHAHIITSSLSQSNFLVTKMVNICNMRGETSYAAAVFHQVIQPNIFLYNSMIQTYANNRYFVEAVSIYKMMLSCPRGWPNRVIANRFTYPFVIKASAGLKRPDFGRMVHGHVIQYGPESNSIIENSLLEMYAKSEELTDAQKLFDVMLDRDTVSWNTLIFAYAKSGNMRKAKSMFDSMPDKSIVSWTQMISGCFSCGLYSDALKIFHGMQVAGLKPDAVSIVAVLPACAKVGALELGRWIHTYSDKNGLLKMVCVCNALIEMYSKCGSIDEAFQLFDRMSQKDIISWSTMIGGLANHGQAHEAISLFKSMQMTGVRPNEITFLGVLSACVHGGLLAEGLRYFDSMIIDHRLKPSIEHYGCVVDLLGRLGSLDKANELIGKMPVAPDAAIWGSLLSASRTHGNIEIAILAMEHLIELEPDDVGNYILLSNTYAAAGKWDDMSRVRKLMRSKGMKKTPGSSLIEVNNVVQEFVAGDRCTWLSDELCSILKLLAFELRRASNAAIKNDVP